MKNKRYPIIVILFFAFKISTLSQINVSPSWVHDFIINNFDSVPYITLDESYRTNTQTHDTLPWFFQYVNKKQRLSYIFSFKGINKEGLAYLYDKRGRLKYSLLYTNDTLTSATVFDKKARPSSENRYCFDKMHGVCYKFHSNGKIMNLRQYDMGRLIDKEYYYRRNGTIHLIITYTSEEKIQSIARFDLKGKMRN